MAIGTVGAIIGASVIGAGASMITGSKAAGAQKDAANQASATERYMYDTTRADYAPYRQVGQGALYKLADMYGVARPVDSPAQPGSIGTVAPGSIISAAHGWFQPPATPAPASPAMTDGFEGFKESPGYAFRRDEALKAIERSAASRGSLGSGGTQKAIARYVDNVASSEYENYANRLATLAGVGQSATSGTAAAGAQAASGIAGAQMAAGNARASAYTNTGNAINQGVQNIAAGYLYNQGFGGGSRTPYPGYMRA